VDLSLAQALGPDGEPSALICILQDIESRKAAESALAEGASALREAQRLAGIGHWRWDPQAERVRWSEELCRILGLDPAEAPARFDGIHRCFAPQAWTRLSEANRRALANGTPYELELEVLRPDGSPGWVLARGEPVRDPAGASVGLRGTLQDITLRREAERASSRDQDGELEDQRQARLAAINLVEDAIAARERAELSAAALKESESRFRTLFRSAAVSIMVHDGTTGEILEANPRALEAYGFETLEELKGRDSCGDFWLDPPYAFEDALKLLRQAVTAGPHHVEWMSAHRQGRIFWEDVLLSPLTLDGAPRVLAICTDITARRSAEEALKLQTDELKRRNEELERFNRATVGRELDMIELKRQVNALCLRLGDEPPFDLGFMDEPQADPEEVAP
jgi:PAS domain S-box-containing protein